MRWIFCRGRYRIRGCDLSRLRCVTGECGLNHLFGLPQTETVQVVLIVVITSLATLSVVSGLDKGIRFLSELNLGRRFCC